MSVRHEQEGIARYTLFDRIVHWLVGLSFIYLMLSGLALGYPRMAWLFDILGGGQTVRWLHPVAGVVFTLGIALMVLAWTGQMLWRKVDSQWARSLPAYVREGHIDLDIGKYNAGQKAYYWFSVVTGVLLFLSGIPLWFPQLVDPGWGQLFRLVHHALFLLTVGGFIVHVYMSTVMFPGTFSSMTTGRVSRRWAAWHHPSWFRDQAGRT
ncbi:MAG TPA: formate dehydrogenase subunit gamma [Actinomycetota bacterium]|nr:formate dehydrogenase subunit gamma [Actinomycetota bacterium]